VAFNPDGQTLASVGSFRDPIRLWNIQQRNPIGELQKTEARTAISAAFSPEGKHPTAYGLEKLRFL